MELKHWTLIISTLADLSDVLPLLVLVKATTGPLKVLRTYFLGSFGVKLLTIVLIFGFASPNTLIYYHLLALFEFVCITLYYRYTIPLRRDHTLVTLTMVGVFNVVNSLFLQHFTEFNSYAWTLNTLVLMVLAFLYLYRLYANLEDVAIEKHSGFIINTGFLLYFAGSLFTYLLGWYILSQKPEGFFANGWIIQAVATIGKNVIVTYGITLSHSHR